MKIPLPERGQPLDLAYIYTLGEAINQGATDQAATTYNKINADNAKSSQTKIVAVTVSNITSGTIAAGSYQNFSVTDFGTFKSIPVATATAIMDAPVALANDVTAILTSVTVSRVDGVLHFASYVENASSVSVNVILVGIPA